MEVGLSVFKFRIEHRVTSCLVSLVVNGTPILSCHRSVVLSLSHLLQLLLIRVFTSSWSVVSS